jgi:hypothetical protein
MAGPRWRSILWPRMRGNSASRMKSFTRCLDTEVHAAMKEIGHKPAAANCRGDVGALASISILYFAVAHSGQEESMFSTKHRGRTISLLTIASSLFSASNLKHRSVLPSLTQRNESRMFHTVALATFFWVCGTKCCAPVRASHHSHENFMKKFTQPA